MKNLIVPLRAIKHTIRSDNWRPDPHLFKQITKRNIALVDVLAAVVNAKRIEPHDMRPLHQRGESFRVYGHNNDGRHLGVGVELVIDDDDNFVVIITAFVKEK
ncbi:MAG: DUF4258 domain-containing protein [Deltaproteobacteria bacterium]|nr:DUF4258 domain-containing protein [Deltaproteobacteria bacterium]